MTTLKQYLTKEKKTMENLNKRPYAINGLDRFSNKTTSPFASRPNEYIVHCDYPEKSTYICQYTISDVEKQVMKVLEELMFATSKMIITKLNETGIEPSKVKNALNSLFNGRYIHKVKFCNRDCDSESSYRVYFISKQRGGPLFRSVFGRYARRLAFAESVNDPAIIKKYLSVNQYLINIYASPLLECGQVIEKKGFLNKFLLRITGSAKIGNDLLFFESIRRSDNTEAILEKAERYSKFLRSPFKNVTPAIEGSSASLIVICENSEHAEEINKLLYKKYRGINVTFIYDTFIFDSSTYVELEKAS